MKRALGLTALCLVLLVGCGQQKSTSVTCSQYPHQFGQQATCTRKDTTTGPGDSAAGWARRNVGLLVVLGIVLLGAVASAFENSSGGQPATKRKAVSGPQPAVSPPSVQTPIPAWSVARAISPPVGATAMQINSLTNQIDQISGHLKTHGDDRNARWRLQKAVNERRQLIEWSEKRAEEA